MQKCPACGNFYNDHFFWKHRRCPFCKRSLKQKITTPGYYNETEPMLSNREELPTEALCSFETELPVEPIDQLLEENEKILLNGEKLSNFLYITGLAFVIFLLIPKTGYFFLAVIFGQIIDFLALASSPNIYLTNNRVIIKEKYSTIGINYDAISAITHYPKGGFKQSELIIDLFNGKQYFLDRIANGREIEDFYQKNQLNLRLQDHQLINVNIDPEDGNETAPEYDISQIPVDQCPACGAKVRLNDRICPSCGIRFID